ncbi:MAG: cytochrome b [Bacteroidetes bacterium]|nr:MAG: cytochrome b [Bacteroidota bacterium]
MNLNRRLDGCTADEIYVWDLSIRVFHWLLVISFITAWYFEGRDIRFHILAGLMIGGLILFRVIWGVCGTEYAKFSSFLPSFATISHHFVSLLHLRADRCVGHTPIGSIMIYAILFCLSLIVASGMGLIGFQFGLGVFFALGSSHDFSAETTVQAIHAWSVDVLYGLIVIHLAGVVAESLLQRSNLIQAMITGKKTV